MGLKKKIKELEGALAKALLIIEEQAKEIEKLKGKIAELEGASKKKEVPSFVKRNIKRRRKKNGQKKGHKGFFRLRARLKINCLF